MVAEEGVCVILFCLLVFCFANLLRVTVLLCCLSSGCHKPPGSAGSTHRGNKEAGPSAFAFFLRGEWNTYFFIF